VPEFRLLVNLLSVSVAPCRGGLCRSPAISHNQHHTASPRHSHNQYTAPIEDGPLVPMFDSRLAGRVETSPRYSTVYAASWLGRRSQRSSAVILIMNTGTRLPMKLDNTLQDSDCLRSWSIPRAPPSLARSCEETKHVSNIILHARMHRALTAYTLLHLPFDSWWMFYA